MLKECNSLSERDETARGQKVLWAVKLHEVDLFKEGNFGGREGDRTLGLRIANAALSQLSYSPTVLKRRGSGYNLIYQPKEIKGKIQISNRKTDQGKIPLRESPLPRPCALVQRLRYRKDAEPREWSPLRQKPEDSKPRD
jgi:hypothetical protein